jgi:hypothetical protein
MTRAETGARRVRRGEGALPRLPCRESVDVGPWWRPRRRREKCVVARPNVVRQGRPCASSNFARLRMRPRGRMGVVSRSTNFA